MKIAILVEGATEVAFREKLRDFLQTHLEQNMPKLKFIPQQGRIPKERKLKKIVENLLDNDGALVPPGAEAERIAQKSLQCIPNAK